ncbi:hypothetical protein JL100_036005 (plasmid) [Skermanella mucosa]|uniref:DUF6969 family protein n=1 Tax=Skermanella mucosa TaxID=1789672 RepID=UPI00192A90EB|nr:hypothetical protein [Skermanella mucosa]UEM25186.1 hypothetical protein JL100_036005 [Skermanella mucosa]
MMNLDDATIERMAEAAAEAVDCVRVLRKGGDNLVGEVLRGNGTFTEWEHYPPDDVYDPETHAQYYFHAHPPEERGWHDYGHFHTFLRPAGMPPGTRPAPGNAPADAGAGDEAALSHLFAISMSREGLPVRLFTTNRWVTGETWYAADDVIAMLDRFVIDLPRPSWPLNRWITAMAVLFRPQIEALLRGRDLAIARRRTAHPDTDVFEDRGLEITSALDISLVDQVAAVKAAWDARSSRITSA